VYFVQVLMRWRIGGERGLDLELVLVRQTDELELGNANCIPCRSWSASMKELRIVSHWQVPVRQHEELELEGNSNWRETRIISRAGMVH